MVDLSVKFDETLLLNLGERLATYRQLWNFYDNCEAEALVHQTVSLAAKRLASGGSPFSFRGDNATLPKRRCGTDNASAYTRLVSDGMFREDTVAAVGVDVPDDVTIDGHGNVPVIYPTMLLLTRLAEYFRKLG